MYLRDVLNMNQYKNYRFADSDKLNFADRKAEQEAEAAQLSKQDQEEELKTKLENGEITQAEYNTLSVTTTQQAKDAFNASAIESITTVDNTALLEQLTDEDLQYLNIK